LTHAGRYYAHIIVLLVGLASWSEPAPACETEKAEISFRGNTYSYTFSTVVIGTDTAVRALVTDYDHLDRINDNITESRVIERYSPDSLKRLLRLKRCILMFCFKLRFVEHVTETAAAIKTTIIPAESTFHDGTAEWLIEPLEAGRTRMILRATQTPKLWIPPLIGPLVLKRVFVQEVHDTCTNIERLLALAPAAT
jgi:hypothetical protein